MKRAIPIVAIIDDDRFALRYYVSAVEQNTGAVVRHYTSALDFVRAVNEGATFDLIVTDVMMSPAGTFTDEETNNGLLTGIKLVEALREACIPCPVIVFTNISTPALIDNIQESFSDDEMILVIRKIDADPFQLAEVIKRQLDKIKGRRPSSTAWSRLLESLQLRPNFMGLGIDLKQLMQPKKGE